jgi:hypothetical protein
MVPVAGTIAALIVIALAHERRGGPPRIPPFDLQDALDHAAPPAEDEEPRPLARTLRLEVQADGTFVDHDGEEAFATPTDLAERLGDAGHTLVLSAGKDVTEAALDEAVRKLRESKLADGTPRFEVRKAPPPEPLELEIELAPDGKLRLLRARPVGAAGDEGDLEEPGDLQVTFASVEEALEKLSNARHKLVLSNGKDVTEAALDEAVKKLQDSKLPGGDPRFQVHKVYRAPEAPPGEGR